jgi:hypothetical protein
LLPLPLLLFHCCLLLQLVMIWTVWLEMLLLQLLLELLDGKGVSLGD